MQIRVSAAPMNLDQRRIAMSRLHIWRQVKKPLDVQPIKALVRNYFRRAHVFERLREPSQPTDLSTQTVYVINVGTSGGCAPDKNKSSCAFAGIIRSRPAKRPSHIGHT